VGATMSWSPRSSAQSVLERSCHRPGNRQTLVYAKGKGIVLCEPFDHRRQPAHRQGGAVGKEAKEISPHAGQHHRHPADEARGHRGLRHTEKMLDYFIKKGAHRSARSAAPHRDLRPFGHHAGGEAGGEGQPPTRAKASESTGEEAMAASDRRGLQ